MSNKQTKYTPWEVDPRNPCRVQKANCVSMDKHIGTCYSPDGLKAEDIAKLIAAAPELVNLLTQCRDWILDPESDVRKKHDGNPRTLLLEVGALLSRINGEV